MSWPFQRNDTAAAFPTFTTNFCEARNDWCAGAMRGSSVRGWPSAEIEIQEFSVARTVSTSEPEDFAVDLAGEFGRGWPKLRTVTSLFSSSAFGVEVAGGCGCEAAELVGVEIASDAGGVGTGDAGAVT